ncbi:helix-turn-helix transcriptional regulator [Streptomyces johnsoniae]|uniref:AraC family transcriptional regulator n=1 Tax=Streptomyces johnsoniae TaxID=3075532 RepID=A0ABU2S0X1_9ACTN|nr:AraC family transcriptional regulator [Streptomyces sp. DSM 41886]MDT0442428.1 AraC family transcriptional regulator [Streptomyces sp. DSM 41886]
MVTLSEDYLADVFRHVEIRGVISGGFAASAPWVCCGEVTDAVKIVAVLRGRAHLHTDGAAPTHLREGDVAILSHRSRLALRGGSPLGAAREIPPPVGWSRSLLDTAEQADTVVGGHVQLGPTGRELLYPGLLPVNHIHGAAPAARRLRAVLGLLLEEASGSEAGSGFAVAQYAQLLVLESLRASAGRTDLPPGWLRLLADEQLRPAVRLMHNDPGRSWQLEQLARAATMSRTRFAESFRRTSGVTPFAYLHRWRIVLAEHALRHSNTSVTVLSARLGYASPSSFSTAFRRTAGVPPSVYRRAHAAPMS